MKPMLSLRLLTASIGVASSSLVNKTLVPH